MQLCKLNYEKILTLYTYTNTAKEREKKEKAQH